MDPHVLRDDRPRLWLRRLHMNLPVTALPRPIMAHVTTQKSSITTPAKTTQLVVEDNHSGLNSLHHGRKIWDRAWSYISPLPFNADATIDPPNPLRVWDCPDVPDQAPPMYIQGLRQLRHIISTNTSRPLPILVNNFSAKDVTDNYIYNVIDAALQMRYSNTASIANDIQLPFRKLPYTPKEELSAEEAQTDIFYPSFSRVILGHHNNPSNNTSGYTDKLLLRDPGPDSRSHCVCSESKTPWAYETETLEDILLGDIAILDEYNLFQKAEAYHGHPGNVLLQQMWGQCVSLNTRIAFVTNVEHVKILLRICVEPRVEPKHKPNVKPKSNVASNAPTASKPVTTQSRPTTRRAMRVTMNLPHEEPPSDDEEIPVNPESGFIVSSLMEWSDPRLITCLVGLCFLAIDEEAWGKPIQDILCPGDECPRIRRNKDATRGANYVRWPDHHHDDDEDDVEGDDPGDASYIMPGYDNDEA